MTFSMLQGMPAIGSISEYSPSGTDEAEAQRYRDSLSSLPVGENLDYDEVTSMLGLGEERDN